MNRKPDQTTVPSKAQEMERRARRSTLRIAFAYAVFGGLWIFISDSLAGALASDHEVFARIQTFKGWAFVAASALLIFMLLRREMKALNALERRLAESEERYRLLFQNSMEAALLTSPDGGIYAANPAACRLFGRSEEEIIRLGRGGLADESDPRLEPALEERARTGRFHGELTFVRADGSRFEGEITSSIFEFNAGTQRTSMIIRDVTERRRMENEVIAARDRLTNVLNSITDAFITLDRDWRITYINPEAARINKKRPEEFLGKIHWEEWPAAIGTEFERQLRKAMAERAPAQFEERYYVEGEYDVWLDVRAYPSGEGLALFYSDISGRKKAEGRLLESEERYRLLVEKSPYAIGIHQDGKIVFANPAAVNLFGARSAADLTGKSIMDLVSPEGREAARERIRRMLQGETGIYPAEDRYLRLDGSVVPVAVTAAPFTHEGRPAIQVIALDITERMRAESDRGRLLNILESSLNEIYVFDPETLRFNYVNSGAARNLGYSLEQLYEMTPLDLKPEFNEESFRRMLEPLIRHEEEVLVFRTVHRRADSSLYHVEAHLQLVEHGRERNFLAIILDVTEREKAEEATRLQLRRLKALRSVDIAIAGTMDLNLVFRVILDEVISQLGADAVDILLFDANSQTLNFAAGRGFRTRALQHTRLPLGEGYAGRVALGRQMTRIDDLQNRKTDFLRSPDFSREEFTSYFGLPLIAKGEIKGVLEVFLRAPAKPNDEWLNFLEALAGQAAIAIDNSTLFKRIQLSNIELEQRVEERTAELNRAYGELERASRAKDEFLASMSHELRSPLNSVIGLSESLLEQERGALSEKQAKYLQMIHSNGGYLLGLINNILDAAKMEAGKLEIHPEPVSVDEVCESSLNVVRDAADKKSISLAYVNARPLTLRADPQRLKQILVNLLANAVKYTPAGGAVSLEVETDVESETMRFSVVDNGIGIAPENLPKLFTPFTQLGQGLSRGLDGTGLGLVIVLKLTELHGGSVHVESAPGDGSRFSVVLPWRNDGSTARAGDAN